MNVLKSVVFCLLALVGTVAPVFRATAEDYRLGSQDRISVRAVIWDETQRAFRIWDLVGGEYTVQADGTVAVPLVGAIAVEGLTTQEFSDELLRQLRDSGGSEDSAKIAVQMVAYRPYYILGDVARPGAYPAQPGLNAVQAMAIAGGTQDPRRRSADPSATMRSLGALRNDRNEIARAQAREARLVAQIAGAETVEFSDTLRHPDGPRAMNRILQEEIAIFLSGKEATERELAALSDLKALLVAEVSGLERKLAGQAEQMRLARETVDRLTSLTERGLAPAARLADAQRGLIDLDAKETDLQNSIYRARQRISENERDIIELMARRETQATVELQQVKAKLEALNVSSSVLEQIILSEGVSVDFTETDGTTTSYEVLRAGSDSDQPEIVGPTTVIGPGDVLTVSTIFEELTPLSQ